MNFTYLVGSIFYYFGGFAALYLWKAEMYGLGMLSEINVVRKNNAQYEALLKA